MDTQGRVKDILSRTDTELRSLIEALLASKRYSEAVFAAKCADTVAQLIPRYGVLKGGEPLIADHAELSDSSEATHGEVSARRVTREFPRFERDGERLVKISWSKRNRAEYEHKAPQVVVDVLVRTIKKKKGEGVLFEASDVLPLKDPQRPQQEVPSYQAYLALAWLQHAGVIRKKGREGYVLKPGLATTQHLEQLWKALPVSV